jgi:hypothetical protein
VGISDHVHGQLSSVLIQSYRVVQAFLNGAVKPFFAPFGCPVTDFAKPGLDAGWVRVAV